MSIKEKPLPKDFGFMSSNSFEEESYWAFEEGEDMYYVALEEWERMNNIKKDPIKTF